MAPRTRPPATAAIDPRLAEFLDADSGPPADRALGNLLGEVAGPIIHGFLRRKFRDADCPDARDAASEARLQITARLLRLRTERDENGPAAEPHRTIADLNAYIATVAYTAWAATLRQRNPARAMLFNRLRYLLENRTGQRGFATWTGTDGRPWAGFEGWRDQPDASADADVAERRQRLAADSAECAAAIFGASGAPAGQLPQMVAGALRWVGGPIELYRLATVIAEWEGVGDPATELPTGVAGEEALATAAPSPHDELRWKEYLGWLWDAVRQLPVRQRTAFLLHSGALRELELFGLASVRRTAAALELAAERMAEFWPRLPLDDRTIAALLNVERQQVINLRKAARLQLGRAWQEWVNH